MSFTKRATSVLVSVVLAAGMLSSLPLCAQAATTTGYVTAAATRAAGPAPEILGLSGVEESGQFVNTTSYYDWTQPKYYLFGDATYNLLANPYFVNLATGLSSSTELAAVVNASRAGGGAGPNGSLGTYGSDTTDDAVWKLLPDVIIGTGGSTDYATEAAKVSSSYSPTGVAYSFSTNADMIDVMYSIAAAGDTAVSTSNGTKSLRYGSATTIATKYEAYIRGTQGYILQQIATDSSVSKKTVAAVSAYDSESREFTLLESGVAEGTASTNRYLEVCENVANVYTNEDKLVCSAQDLVKAGVDLVLVGGQSSGSLSGATVSELLVSAGFSGVVYYTSSTTAGAAYGVVMNSVENAQNIGRILGCLYPNLINQNDWVCYYYSQFYHIAATQLGAVVSASMDGVYHYSSDDTTWDVSCAKSYAAASVTEKLAAGVTYLDAQSELNSALALTSSASDLVAALEE